MPRHLLRCVIIALSCLLLQGAPRTVWAEFALDGAPEGTIVSAPFELLPGFAMPFVRVKLDDDSSYLLALDLGVPYSNLDASLARKSKFKVSREKLSSGETTDVLRSAIRPAPLTGTTGGVLPAMRFVLADLTAERAEAPEMAGRLGADLLAGTVIKLNFNKKRIDFIAAGKLVGSPLEPKGVTPIPLHVENGLVLFEGQVDGAPARFMLSCLDQTVLRSPKTVAALKPLYHLAYTTDPGGSLAPVSVSRLGEIRIGDAVWKQPLVAQMATPENDIPDALALDMLSHFRVTIDLPAKSMYLEPDPDSKAAEVQHFGLGMLPRKTPDGHLIIASISVPSPAAEAKLKVGDEIVAINNLEVAQTPIEKIAAEAGKPEGTEVTLSILRKGQRKPREYKLTVRRLL